MSDQFSTPTEKLDYVEIAADIVAAYVTNNSVRAAELPELIASVHAALRGIANPVPKEDASKPRPAVDPKKSVTPDHLISLLDGRKYKSLKRHLTTRGMTPEQYRAAFDLRPDYPMVAANYAKQRSELAKALGLGQIRSRARTVAAKAADTVQKVTGAVGKSRAKAAAPKNAPTKGRKSRKA